MSRVVVVTDSTPRQPPAVAQAPGHPVVPRQVVIGGCHDDEILFELFLEREVRSA